MSGLTLFGACAAIFLPETLGQRLPETLAEAKVFGRGQPFWGIPKANIKHLRSTSAEREKLNKSEYAL